MSVLSPNVGSINWFAQHELNLSWRDFVRMMTAGRTKRARPVIFFMMIATLILHTIAYLFLKPALAGGIAIDTQTFIMVSGTLILTFSLMMSQAMELVTRVFYSRSDLDLILSSPVSEKKLFTVRIGAIAIATSMLSVLLFSAAINVLAIFDSAKWLAAYPVLLACGAVATSLSLWITVFLFKTLGAKKTRLISQIIAAIVGAGFVIGIQLAAISTLGSISRFEFLRSDLMVGLAPAIDSLAWIPARAIAGEIYALLITLVLAFSFLWFTIMQLAAGFGQHVVKAAGVSQTQSGKSTSKVSFTPRSVSSTLRRKEWKLLLRDPWLISQTLMQILYLLPPAFMLWQSFGTSNALGIVALPVLVMATGQLSGGLAWLAISGEDAQQLVQTAPLNKAKILRAKIEAVLGAIAIVVSPILLILAFLDVRLFAIATGGIVCATISATMIQIWFRSQAKRSNFRRRQTSSKVATLSEALVSIMWAATTGIVAGGLYLTALVPVAVAIVVLWIARSFRPQQEF